MFFFTSSNKPGAPPQMNFPFPGMNFPFPGMNFPFPQHGPNFIRIEIPGHRIPAIPKSETMSREEALTILDVKSDISLKELKKVYRQLVTKWHPDKNPEDKKAEAEIMFKKITKAYQVLSEQNNNISVETPKQECNQDKKEQKFAHKAFEEFLFDGLSTEDHDNVQEDLDTEAENLFDFLQKASSSNMFTFGPPPDSNPPPAPEVSREPEAKQDPEAIKTLQFRVHISIEDTWKNTNKELPLQQFIPNTIVKLPLYYEEIQFKPSKANLQFFVKIRDKTHPIFRRVGNGWDLESVCDMEYKNLRRKHVLRVPLPDNTYKKVWWDGTIEKIQNSIEKGFVLPNLGLPSGLDPSKRGDLLVRLRLILSDKDQGSDEEKPADILIPTWEEENTWRQRWTLDQNVEKHRKAIMSF